MENVEKKSNETDEKGLNDDNVPNKQKWEFYWVAGFLK